MTSSATQPAPTRRSVCSTIIHRVGLPCDAAQQTIAVICPRRRQSHAHSNFRRTGATFQKQCSRMRTRREQGSSISRPGPIAQRGEAISLVCRQDNFSVTENSQPGLKSAGARPRRRARLAREFQDRAASRFGSCGIGAQPFQTLDGRPMLAPHAADATKEP